MHILYGYVHYAYIVYRHIIYYNRVCVSCICLVTSWKQQKQRRWDSGKQKWSKGLL